MTSADEIAQNAHETAVRRAYQPLLNAWHDQTATIDGDIVIAVSGGVDSRALLELCGRLSGAEKTRIHVVTVDHHTGASSRCAAENVLKRAQQLGFRRQLLEDASQPASNADAAEHTLRALRYDLLTSYAVEHDCISIVTGHQRDDVAEGFLMNIFGWGGGAEGASMEQVRPLSSQVSLHRPFLRLGRDVLRKALEVSGIDDYHRDPADLAGLNRRAQVRTFLAEFEPGVRKRLAELSFRERERADALVATLEDYFLVQQSSAEITVRPGRELPSSAARTLWRMQLKRVLSEVTDVDMRSGRKTLDSCTDAIISGNKGKFFQLSGAEVHIEAANHVHIRLTGPSRTSEK